MKCSVLLLFFSIFPFHMDAQNDSVPVFTGKFNPIITETEWFQAWISSDSLMLDEGLKARLQALTSDQISFKVYIGTWCSDSKIHVPQFLQLAQVFGWRYELIGVNREKECPFDKKECKSWDIAYLPTFIVYRNEQELGRIVENPQKSLAEDFETILAKP